MKNQRKFNFNLEYPIFLGISNSVYQSFKARNRNTIDLNIFPLDDKIIAKEGIITSRKVGDALNTDIGFEDIIRRLRIDC